MAALQTITCLRSRVAPLLHTRIRRLLCRLCWVINVPIRALIINAVAFASMSHFDDLFPADVVQILLENDGLEHLSDEGAERFARSCIALGLDVPPAVKRRRVESESLELPRGSTASQ